MTIAATPGSVLARLVGALTPDDRRRAAREALERVDVDWAPRPVPRAFLDLPRITVDTDDAAWDIAAQVLGAADPFSPDALESVKLGDRTGKAVTVHDLRVRPLSAAEVAEDPERTIGAYLMLAVSFPPNDTQQVAFTGSPRIVAPLVYAWAAGRLPITGTVVEVGTASGKRSAPLAFVQDAF